MSLPARQIRPGPDHRPGAFRALTSLAALFLLLSSYAAQAQPRMSVSIAPDTVQVGEATRLSVEVRWTGSSDRFVLYPPKLKLPGSVHQGALTQHFETLGAETVYHYDYTITADQPGDTALGTVTLDYRELNGPDSSQAANAAATAPDAKPDPIVEDAPTVKVLPGGARGTLGRFLLPGGALVIVLGALVRRRRRLRPRPVKESAPSAPEPLALLEAARKAMTEGRLDEVYALLIRLKPSIPGNEDPLPSVEQLEAERLRARYGGGSSPQGELERLVRAVEVVLKPARHETCKD